MTSDYIAEKMSKVILQVLILLATGTSCVPLVGNPIILKSQRCIYHPKILDRAITRVEVYCLVLQGLRVREPKNIRLYSSNTNS